MDFPCELLYNYDSSFDEKKINNDVMVHNYIYDLRKAAYIHKNIRNELNKIIKPGVKILDICNFVENKITNESEKIKKFFPNDSIGIGFPTCISINNIAAHDTASINDNRIINYNDVVKIDYGVHSNGYIIDSAFTKIFNPIFEPIQLAAKEAVDAGIKLTSPDILINEISSEIQEIVESFEIELNNNIYKIKPATNLGGHTINKYNIHAGKILLSVPNIINNYVRMKEGEIWAIEVFPTTGKQFMTSDKNIGCNNYKLNIINFKKKFKFKITNELYNFIKINYKTMPFCTRWLYNNFKHFDIGLNELLEKNILSSYYPLISSSNSIVSQYEHTLYLHEFGKELFTRDKLY
jgi:methionyl aminopeptidase